MISDDVCDSQQGVGDLFGALIRRKVHTASDVYQQSELFNLSLPPLGDGDAPDIYVPGRTPASYEPEIGYEEEKSNCNKVLKPVEVEVRHSTNNVQGVESAPTNPYFSLAPRPIFTEVVQKAMCVQLSSARMAELTLLAFKGVSSQLYDDRSLPPAVTVQGYTGTAVRGFMVDVRTYFIMRTMLNAAVTGLASSGDTAGQALGSQLGVLLHLFDISLAEHSDSVTVMATCAIDNTNTQGEATALVSLWEHTQLHRSFLSHLVSVIRPEGAAYTVRELGQLVVNSSEGSGSSVNPCALLNPSSWTELGGWALLHRLVQSYSLSGHCVDLPTLPRVFQHGLFRNAAAMQLRTSTSTLASDYAKMVLTASLVKQAAVPLLAQLSDKLYALDADFDTSDTVTDSELSSSLRISIDSLWEEYAGRNDGGAERCVEFLLSALAWARGRISLMLLEGLGTAHNSLTAGTAVAMGRRSLPVPVREDAPLRVPKLKTRKSSTESPERIVAFDRAALIATFRQHRPELVLPLNSVQAQALGAIRTRSMALHEQLRGSTSASIGAWCARYATMSDYYTEHATQAKSMFANVDYHIRRPVPVPVPVPSTGLSEDGAPVAQRVFAKAPLAGSSRDAAPPVEHSRTADAEETAPPPPDSVILSTTVGTERTVPKALIAEAELKIRAKYESLMRGVTSRSTATAWRKRQLQTLPEARRQLKELFQEDQRELERLQQAKHSSPDKYSQFVAQHAHFQEHGLPATDSADDTPPLHLSLPKLEPKVAQRAAGKVTEPSPPLFGEKQEEIGANAVKGQGSADIAALPPGRASHSAEDGATGAVGDHPVPTESPADAGALASEPKTDETKAVTDSVSKTAAAGSSLMAPVIATDSEVPSEPESVSQPQEGHAGEASVPTQAPLPSTPTVSDEPVPVASQQSGLEALAAPLLKPDESYLDEEDRVFSTAKSLAHTIARLARSTRLLDLSEQEVADLIHRLRRDDTRLVEDESALWEAVLTEAGKASTSTTASKSALHSLRAMFMRSLGQAVLAQCRTINLAALHCLVSGSVDLLGHVSAVDHLFLVSPNSDFLMSLCTGMVDQHLQLTRVLQRQQRDANVSAVSLSHQFADRGNAELWNAEALSVAFAATMSASSASSGGTTTSVGAWKEYGILYAVVQIAKPGLTSEAAGPVSSTVVAELSSLWGTGLFSSSGLAALKLQYRSPWPVPAIITDQVLAQVCQITRRFLHLGQVVALFRVVWGEMRLYRVQRVPRTSHTMKQGKKSGSTKTEPAAAVKNPASIRQASDRVRGSLPEHRYDEVERRLSDALRLVQQAVQTLFDYLSERVYVHQARFKASIKEASERGLDGVVDALAGYSAALAASALQLTPSEEALVREYGKADGVPDRVIAQDPGVALKWAVNSMVESCLHALLHVKQVNDLRSQAPNDSGNSESVDEDAHVARMREGLDELAETCRRVQAHRTTLVAAAERLSACDMSHGDLQSLLMRFKL